MMNPSCLAGTTCPQCGCTTNQWGAQPWTMGGIRPWGMGGFQPGMMGGFQPWMGTYGSPFAGQGQMGGFGGQFAGQGAPWGPYGQAIGGWAYPGYGLGGLRSQGGNYSPQFTGTGLPTDEEIAEMVYDSIDDDPLIPWDAEIDVDVDAGEVTLTGTVPNKRIKHAAGDDVWWIPGVTDVHNKMEVSGRRRTKSAPTEGKTTGTAATRARTQK